MHMPIVDEFELEISQPSGWAAGRHRYPVRISKGGTTSMGGPGKLKSLLIMSQSANIMIDVMATHAAQSSSRTTGP